jgi:hypothetical protein
MAIAFVAAGASAGVSVGSSSGSVAVPVPAGASVGQLLLAFLLYDCNANGTGPAGWTRIIHARADHASGGYAPPTVDVWSRVVTGSEGSGQTFTFSTSTWPTGQPDVLGTMLLYSGTDTVSPVEVAASATVGGNFDQLQTHPQVTTSTANGWLITYRGRSGSLSSYASNVGTDTDRADGTYDALSMSVLDSNAALAAGTQTQRITASGARGSDGDVMLSIALKILPSSSAGVATAGVARVTGTALDATATSVTRGWDLCTAGLLPQYVWAVDWAQTGLAAAGRIISQNPYTWQDASGWAGNNASVAWTGGLLLSGRTVPVLAVTPDGVSAAGGVNQVPHGPAGSVVPGQSYVADCWVWSATGWSDVRAAVDWYTAADVFISSSTGSATAAVAGTWTHLQQTFTAPATASRPVMRFRYGGSPAVSQKFYVFGLVLMDPSQPEDQITPAPTDVVGTDMTSDGATWSYGRDQNRQTSPAALGTASFRVNNSNRVYSPENAASPLAGTLDAARTMTAQVVFNGVVFPLFTGRINDYNITSSRADRSVSFTFLDLESGFQNTEVTTPLYSGIRTGDAIGLVLDAVGWTGPRDLDPGATVMPWWWLNLTAAGTAINDLVASEGPPAIAYVAPDGTFTFRDRTHRLIRPQSLDPQGVYAAQEVDCAAPAVTGLSYTDPIQYAHGWRDIINDVTFQVPQRAPNASPSVVWSTTAAIPVTTGQTVVLTALASDPFIGAMVPVLGTDYTVTGAGTLNVTLGQTSGMSTTLMLQATGADLLVQGMQLQAFSVPVVSTATVERSDPTSIDDHGTQSYPGGAPWAGVADADAVAEKIVARYAQRRPLVQIRVVSSDPAHYAQVLGRTVSDRITIVNGELGMDSDFYVEHVEHTALRMDWSGRPPVHAVVLGCEQEGTVPSANPFTFDLRGAGFDQGVWDPSTTDDPTTVFIFDDPVQGCFDIGRLGT